MVMHSTTKYISGHSDVVGGALITRFDNYLFERVRTRSAMEALFHLHSIAG